MQELEFFGKKAEDPLNHVLVNKAIAKKVLSVEMTLPRKLNHAVYGRNGDIAQHC